MATQGAPRGGRKDKKKVKAGKLMKSKQIAKAVRNTRKKGKKTMLTDTVNILKASEDDVLKMLAAQMHIGRKNAHVNMKRYIWKRRSDGIYVFNLEKTWAKLVLAARIIVTVKDPSEIMVMSARTYGQRGAIKFAKHTGASAHAGKWVPGTLTNPQNKAFVEPRLIIVDDPMTNFAALRETSYIGIPVIAFCNSDNNTRFVDCAIPCNNKGRYSVGLMFWFLAREVLRMRGRLARSSDWFKENRDACPDLFFYRDPNEIAKAKKDREEKERAAQEQAQQSNLAQLNQDSAFGPYGDYGGADVGTGGAGTGLGGGLGGDDMGNVGGGYDDGVDQSWQVEPPMTALDDWGDNTGNQGFDNVGGGYDDGQQQQQQVNQGYDAAPPQQQQQQQPQDQGYGGGYYDQQPQQQQPQQQQPQQGAFQDW